MNFLAHIFVCGSLILLLEGLWVAVFAKAFYQDELGRMLADAVRPAPAVFLLYPLYTWALLYFALEPALKSHDLVYGIKHAALLSLTAFAMYDLSNRSLLRRWPLRLVTVDIIWGVGMSVAVVAAGYAVFP